MSKLEREIDELVARLRASDSGRYAGVTEGRLRDVARRVIEEEGKLDAVKRHPLALTHRWGSGDITSFGDALGAHLERVAK